MSNVDFLARLFRRHPAARTLVCIWRDSAYRFPSRQALRIALDELSTAGVLEPVRLERKKTGRPPGPAWRLKPPSGDWPFNLGPEVAAFIDRPGDFDRRGRYIMAEILAVGPSGDRSTLARLKMGLNEARKGVVAECIPIG